ncbi:hypothetical protein D3C71_1973600 [compost metagenome]
MNAAFSASDVYATRMDAPCSFISLPSSSHTRVSLGTTEDDFPSRRNEFNSSELKNFEYEAASTSFHLD